MSAKLARRRVASAVVEDERMRMLVEDERMRMLVEDREAMGTGTQVGSATDEEDSRSDQGAMDRAIAVEHTSDVHPGEFVGKVTGEVTGKFTGKVTGEVTADVTGKGTVDVTGKVTADVMGGQKWVPGAAAKDFIIEF